MKNKKIIYLLLLILILVLLFFRVTTGKMPAPFTFEGFSIWLGAFFTLAVMSFLYKDNPFYRAAEHLFIGVSAAYYMVIGIWTTLIPNCLGKLFPALMAKLDPELENSAADYSYFLPLLFGLLLLFRFSKKLGYLSKITLAFIIGLTAGLNFLRYFTSDFIGQIKNTLIPVVVFTDNRLDLYTSLSNFILVTGVLSTLVYFFYSYENKGLLKKFSRFGVYILMITFGATFGNSVMNRIALLVARFEFLLKDWLRFIQ